MIEEKVSKSSLDNPDYFFKKDGVKKDKKESKKNNSSGTNFNEYGYNLFSRIQLFFACLSLILIPISLFPLEWIMFEYGRVFVLISFTIILLTFELIKFFIRGKLEVFKNPRDVFLLLLGVSFFVSFLFSSDTLVSFWGYEYRFGTGFISIIAILIYVLILKSMIKNIRSLVSLISSLSFGLFLSAILSIFSFYGLNPFGMISEFDKFFFTGLPFFNSAKLSVAMWAIGILLSFFSFYYFFRLFSDDESHLNKKLSLSKVHAKKRAIQISLFSLFAFAAFVFIIAISLFTIKNLFWIGVFSLLGVILIFSVLALLCTNNILKISTLLVLILSISIFTVSRLPFTQNILSIDQDNLIEQVTLDSESIWSITVSSLSDSFSRSLVGLGNDNFIVAYNLHRPAFSDDIDLNFVNYSYANNEVYNIVANRGFVGIFVWLVIGLLLISQFFRYLADETSKKMISSISIENVGIILLDLLLFYIWIYSFFTYYSFILYFVLFFLIAISSLLKNIAFRMSSETLVVQTNFFVERIGLVKNESLPKFFIFFVCFISIFSLYYTFNDFSSRMYAVRAESIMYDLEKERSDQEARLQKAIDNYDQAIEKNPNNYVFRRKVSLILMDYVNNVLSKEYSNLTDDAQRQEFIRVVGVYAEASLEESKKATELGPMVAINWSTRDSIYSELVKMGFHNYMNTALKVSEQSILREPNNYNSYINKATYLYIMGDAGGAISEARRALEINPYYIPGLALAGEISMGMQDYANAKTYFENAKILLEEMDFTRPGVVDLYEQVQENLNYLWSLEVENIEPEVVEEELSDLPDEEVSD